jgi:predicted nucleic acid-binding protein
MAPPSSRTVFADTSLFVAYLSKTDKHHAKSRKWMSDSGISILTSQWVLAELANYFASSPMRSLASALIADLATRPRTETIEVSTEQFDAGIERYQRMGDKQWSLVDCISFNIMAGHSVFEALTTDHHFTQAGFVALLRDE